MKPGQKKKKGKFTNRKQKQEENQKEGRKTP